MFCAWYFEMFGVQIADANGGMAFGYSNAVLNTAAWLIERWNCKYKITNCSNVPIEVTMYEYIARRDMPALTSSQTFPMSGAYGSDQTWSDMVLMDAVMGSSQSGAYQGGPSNILGPTGPSGWPSNPGATNFAAFDYHYDPGANAIVSKRINALTNLAGGITYAKPYDGLNITQDFSIYRCPMFTRRFKIVKRTKLRCLPGSECMYLFRQRKPKLIKFANYMQTTMQQKDHTGPIMHQCLDGEKGYYRGLLCQLRGQVGNDSTVKDNVGTTVAGLNILCNEAVTITWNPLKINAKSVKYGAQRAIGASGYLFNNLDPTAILTYPLANPAAAVTAGTTHA